MALVLALALFTACGSSATPAVTEAPAADAAATEAPAADAAPAELSGTVATDCSTSM